jgi:ABC-type antimicrobial peptide transport system permease subunit
VLGLPISLIGLRALTILLRFPWPVTLPPITAIATTGVIIVATIAVWIPAQRAASVDPASTLRRG